jgi:hypothetical protein
MAKPFSSLSDSSSPKQVTRIGIASAIWLTAAPVLAHFTWDGAPWYMVVLLAAMAELLALTVWLIGSTFNDPVKRWDLPPNPADAQKGWRGKLAVVRSTAGGVGQGLRQKLLRRPAKV